MFTRKFFTLLTVLVLCLVCCAALAEDGDDEEEIPEGGGGYTYTLTLVSCDKDVCTTEYHSFDSETGFELPALTREGDTFLGWARSRGGKPAFAAGDTFNETTTRLFALWKNDPVENGFTYYIDGQAAVVCGYNGDNTALTVPAALDGRPVTAVGDYAFYKMPLTAATLPDSIKTIGENAFYYCSKITEVNLGNVETIGDHAFHGCSKLTSADIGNVKAVGHGVFSSCHSLTTVNSGKVETIDDFAFSYCRALTDIDFTNVTAIGKSAFRQCTGLTDVNLRNVETIGDHAFYECTGLTGADFRNAKTIDDYAFSGCTELTDTNFEKAETIGKNAFEDCAKLTAAVFSNGASIDAAAFLNCTGLKSVDFGSVKTIGSKAFSGCAGLTDVDFGSVETIGSQAFYECTGLTKLVFRNAKKIGLFAFHSCTGVTEIELNAVETLNGKSFRFCSAVKKVTLSSTLTKLDGNPYDICSPSPVVFYTGTAEQWNGITGVNDWNGKCTVICLGMPGAGTAASPLQISSAEAWKALSAAMEYDMTTDGKVFTLTNDIDVSTMIGSADHPFRGVFDGAGHTLKFTYEDHPQITAPFRYVDGATIRNLHATGSITGSDQRASGLIGENSGASTVSNCRVSTEISGSNLIGGFCVGTGNTLAISGSVFDGKITGRPGQSGCFVAWGTRGLSVTDSLAAPQSGSDFTGGTFCYNGGGAPALSNCYYLQSPGNAQGLQAYSVTAGRGVTLGIDAEGTVCGVGGITVYPTGLTYNDVFYAGAGETVALSLSAVSWEGYDLAFDASAGSLSASGSGWTLTMPAGDTVISFRRTPAFATAPAAHLTADGGTDGYNDQDPDKLFDGDDVSKWCCAFEEPNYWTEFHSDLPIVPTAYSMTTAADAANYLRRNPISWQLLGRQNREDGWTVLAAEENCDHLPAENCVEVFFPLNNSAEYRYFRLDVTSVNSGAQLQIAELKLIGVPSRFGTPDFTLPAGITKIDDNAFEGAAVTVAYVPDGCAFIGAEAFRSCGTLVQIRVPADCALGADVFDGCALVYVYGTAGSPAEDYCAAHGNCVFVAE